MMEREDAARVAEWAARLVGEAAVRAARDLEDLVPKESRAHLLKAQRELFLAANAAIQHRRNPQGAKAQRRQARKIPLD
jgi:CO/xanthine dehydrogenase Mo-binding subunit